MDTAAAAAAASAQDPCAIFPGQIPTGKHGKCKVWLKGYEVFRKVIHNEEPASCSEFVSALSSIQPPLLSARQEFWMHMFTNVFPIELLKTARLDFDVAWPRAAEDAADQSEFVRKLFHSGALFLVLNNPQQAKPMISKSIAILDGALNEPEEFWLYNPVLLVSSLLWTKDILQRADALITVAPGIGAKALFSKFPFKTLPVVAEEDVSDQNLAIEYVETLGSGGPSRNIGLQSFMALMNMVIPLQSNINPLFTANDLQILRTHLTTE